MNAAQRIRDFSLSHAHLGHREVNRALAEVAGVLRSPVGLAALARRTAIIVALAVVLVLFERLAPAIAIAAVATIMIMRHLAKADQNPVRSSTRVTRSSAGTSAAPSDDVPMADVIPLNNVFAPAWEDVDDFLQAVLDVIKTRFEFQSANIFLRGEDPAVLVQRAYVSHTKSIARLATIRVGHGLVGWVAQHKRPLVVGNLHHEGRSMGYYRTAGEQVASFAAAPIFAKGQVVGVIAMDHHKADAYPAGTDEALSAIAGLLARVLGAEETMDQSRRETDRIRESWRLLVAAYGATDLDAAAEAAIKELVVLADFQAIAIYLLDENGVPSRRAAIGFHGIWGNEVKEPMMQRAVAQALQQASPFKLEGVALAAQYRATRVQNPNIPEALLALPILEKGQALGVLVVEVASVKTLDDRVEGILVDVVSNLGAALVRVYNAALAANAAASEGELVKFSRSLLSADSTEEIWDRVFSLLVKKTAATSALAYRRTASGYAIEAVAGCTPTENFLPLDEGLLGWTALAGRPVLAARGDRRRAPVEEGESFIAFPVGAGRNPHSVVVLVSTQKDAFSAAHMETVRGVAETVHPVLVALDRLEEARRDLDTDMLTGAMNDGGFRKRLGVMAISGEVSVLSLNVDNLGALLAEYGRKEVGTLLRRIANLLSTAVGSDGVVARIDGGCFAVAVRGEVTAVARSVAEFVRGSSLMSLYESPVHCVTATASTAEGLTWEQLPAAAESRLGKSDRNLTAEVA